MGLTGSSVGIYAVGQKKRTACEKCKQSNINIALAGNPNVGKSTLFNVLTGLNQHTGNWPGKTVLSAFGSYEYMDGKYTLVDLPGTYSLNANSPEEETAGNYICIENPDITVVVADATSLERNFNLLFQILEITENVILCVNLVDEAKKKKITVDVKKLSEILRIPVVALSAGRKKGIDELKKTVYNYDKLKGEAKNTDYGAVIERAFDIVAEAIIKVYGSIDKRRARWLSMRILEKNEKAIMEYCEKNNIDVNLPQIQLKIKEAQKLLECSGIDTSKLHERLISDIYRQSEEICSKCVVKKDKSYYSRDYKIDRILTSKKYGIPSMILLLMGILWLTVTGANYPSQIISNILFGFEDDIFSALTWLNFPEWSVGLIVLGVYRTLAWIVSVMLPPMAIFFPLFTFLEDLGYLPRVAFNLDGFFQKSHTCGKQALTMCMGLGCNAAGVVGCRIIDSPRERLIAIITNSFVPCNGRFPLLITVGTMFFAGMLWGESSLFSAVLVAALIVFGVMITLFVSKFLSKTFLKGMSSSFVMEMPPYRRPQAGKIIIRSVFDRTLFVLFRAVCVAAPAGAVIWIMANINIGDISILERCAAFLDPIGRLAGMDGYILLAFILGFPANEIVMPIIIMSYMSAGYMTEYSNIAQLHELLVQNGWTWVTALCVMIFSLVHFPCATTILTIKKETQSLKWTVLSFLLPLIIGFSLCVIVSFVSNTLISIFG